MRQIDLTKQRTPRRRFLQTSMMAGAAMAAAGPFVRTTHAAAVDKIRVGVVGCGGRGTGAALNVIQMPTKITYPPPGHGYHTENAVVGAKPKAGDVEIVALADLFPERLNQCRRQLCIAGVDVPEAHCFTGFDGCRKLLEIPEINYVIFATPPQFRPGEFRAAIEAGKNVFIEKPIAVDAPGVRSVIETGKLAASKGLTVGAGTVRRHRYDQRETIKRLRGGAIGDIVEAQAYFNVGEIWAIPRVNAWSDLEWQHRDWPYFTWLSGDIIVEQHIHMLDAVNWVLGAHPLRAYGNGGRISHPPGGTFGHIYDHFSIEYEYPGGVRMFSMNRQIAGADSRVANRVLGTKGSSNCQDTITASKQWRYDGPMPEPYQQEHRDFLAAIRSGKPINETKLVAEATLTAMMGRESAYSGQVVEWDAMLNSQRSLTPDKYEFGPAEMPKVASPNWYKFK